MRGRDICSAIIRFCLLVASSIGWITLTVGGWLQYRHIATCSHYVIYHNGFLALFAILWIGAVLSYILTLLHLIVNLKYKNAVHIMHCVLIGYSILFTLFGGLSVVAALLYFTVQPINGYFLKCFDHTYMKVMLSGTIITVLFQWISSCIWPLFNYERHPHRQDYQALEESVNFR